MTNWSHCQLIIWGSKIPLPPFHDRHDLWVMEELEEEFFSSLLLWLIHTVSAMQSKRKMGPPTDHPRPIEHIGPGWTGGGLAYLNQWPIWPVRSMQAGEVTQNHQLMNKNQSYFSCVIWSVKLFSSWKWQWGTELGFLHQTTYEAWKFIFPVQRGLRILWPSPPVIQWWTVFTDHWTWITRMRRSSQLISYIDFIPLLWMEVRRWKNFWDYFHFSVNFRIETGIFNVNKKNSLKSNVVSSDFAPRRKFIEKRLLNVKIFLSKKLFPMNFIISDWDFSALLFFVQKIEQPGFWMWCSNKWLSTQVRFMECWKSNQK